jgi:hypothetical protein
MSLDSRLRHLEDKTPGKACAKCGRSVGPMQFEIDKAWPSHRRVVPVEKCSECGAVTRFSLQLGPDAPQYDEVMTALILCGAVTPCQTSQNSPQSA